MAYKLSENIKEGEKIKTKWGWRRVKEVTDEGAQTEEEFINFGEKIYGWKKK